MGVGYDTFATAIPVYFPDSSGNPTSFGQATALPAGTDRGGSITSGGTQQTVAAANASRAGLTFQNTSDTVMYLSEDGVNASATHGFQLAAGVAVNVSTNQRISVFCATTGKTFAATEY